MSDVVGRAAVVVDLLEASDAVGVDALLAPRVRGWPVEHYLTNTWNPGLDELAGSPRRVAEAFPLSDTMARFVVVGDRGRGVVTVHVDGNGRLFGLALEDSAFEGIGTVVMACPADRRREMAVFYAGLVGRDRWRKPRFAFGESRAGYRAPRWPDPEHPQQLHLDLFTSEPDAAHRQALAAGATLLRDGDDHRTYADPVGHPFCLHPEPDVLPRPEPVPTSSADPSRPPAKIGRIVVDCFSPRALAPFYEGLLGMTVRAEDSVERVVIGGRDGDLPLLGFQQVTPYLAPRWPDPAFPQQVHLDLKFDDGRAARQRAEDLGAIRLPSQGGSCPVYADPAGHPFCLCMPGE